MKAKTKKTTNVAWLILFVLCIISVALSAVLAKYVEEKGGTGSVGSTGSDFSYQFENPIEVSSPEELYNAVEYGYSHIRFAQADAPIFFSEESIPLTKSMVLDLNGNEIQRNSRSPILTVTEGTKLTIVDSSANQTGGFYNPVGSVLAVTGGTLSVQAGKFEIGPRYWEYYSYGTNANRVSTSGVEVATSQQSDVSYVIDTQNNTFTLTKTFKLNAGDATYPNGYITVAGVKEGDNLKKFGLTAVEGVEDQYTTTIFGETYTITTNTIDGTTLSGGNLDQPKAFDKKGNVVVEMATEQAPSSSADQVVVDLGGGYSETYTRKTEAITPHQTMESSSVTPLTSYPVILPTKESDTSPLNGNVYLNTDALGTLGIPADTYLYWVSSNGQSSADLTADIMQGNGVSFTYKYYADPNNNYGYLPSGSEKVQYGTLNADYVEITVYGYLGNVERASTTTNDNPYYAAVKMTQTDGTNGGQVVVEVDAKKFENSAQAISYKDPKNSEEMGAGCFLNYFGVPQTSCIYLDAGELTINEAGAFVAVGPNHLEQNPNATAQLAMGTCISTSATNTGQLVINDGLYRAYNMNTIRVLHGNVTVNGGVFDKFSTLDGNAQQGRAAVYVGQATAVDVGSDTTVEESGECNISNAFFRITSKSNQELEGAASEFGSKISNYNGENVYGMYVQSGDLTVRNTTFHMKASYATALFVADANSLNASQNGTQQKATPRVAAARADLDSVVVVMQGMGEVGTDNMSALTKGKAQYGIASLGGSISVKDSFFNMAGDNSSGIMLSGAYVGNVITGGGELVIENTSDTRLANTHKIKGWKAGDDTIIETAVESFASGQFFLTGENSVALLSRGGNIFSRGIDYWLSGKKSFGVYAKAGNIEFQQGTVRLEHPDNSYGIIAVSDADEQTQSSLMVDVKHSTIVVGGKLNTDNTVDWSTADRTPSGSGYYGASMGVFIADVYRSGTGTSGGATHECYVSMVKTDIYSIDMGIGVRGGDVFLENNCNIQTKNSSVLAVEDGSVYVGKVKDSVTVNGQTINLKEPVKIGTHDATTINALTIEQLDNSISVLEEGSVDGTPSKLTMQSLAGLTTGNAKLEANSNWDTEDSWDADGTINIDKFANLKFTTPDPKEGSLGTTKQFDYYDGIIINKGSFFAVEQIDLTYTGFLNKKQNDGDFAKAYETSFAMRVLGGDVEVRKADVTNSIGGGIGVSGGDVVLGSTTTTRDDIKVTTTGNVKGSAYDGSTFQYYNYNNTDLLRPTSNNWKIPRNLTGGSAISVVGGNLTVENGTYKTNFGSAVNILSQTADEDSVSKITIKDGWYQGNTQKADSLTYEVDGKDVVKTQTIQGGPGTYYGLKVLGNSLVNIYGGTFGGGNGGAMISGVIPIEGKVPNMSDESTYNALTANVYIYAGNFGYVNGMDECFDAFNIFEGVNIVFGAYKQNEQPSNFNYKTGINVKGDTTGLAVNALGSSGRFLNGKASSLYIYYGSYQGCCPNTSHGNNCGNTTCDHFDALYNNGAINVNNASSKLFYGADVYVYNLSNANGGVNLTGNVGRFHHNGSHKNITTSTATKYYPNT